MRYRYFYTSLVLLFFLCALFFCGKKSPGVTEKKMTGIIDALAPRVIPVSTRASDEANFFHAVRDNNVARMEELLKKGVPVDTAHNYGSDHGTALTYAACQGNKEAFDFLIARGADIHAVTQSGKSVIMAVASESERPNQAILEQLFGKGLLVEARSANGKTALTFAAESGNKEMVEYLLSKGANPNNADIEGRNILMNTVENCYADGCIDVLNILIDHGAFVPAVDFKGQSALDYANKRRDDAIIRFLRDKGAQ